jgi:chemotaxis signal transduction protein
VSIEVPSAEGDRSFLLVRSGGSFYALPADRVRHVVRRLACHPVPGGRPYLLGLAQFAGEPLAVLDLHSMVEGIAPQSHHNATVILGSGSRDSWSVIGLAVNEALRVFSHAGAAAENPAGELVEGTLELETETARLVNTARLFHGDVAESGGGDG